MPFESKLAGENVTPFRKPKGCVDDVVDESDELLVVPGADPGRRFAAAITAAMTRTAAAIPAATRWETN
jgi:hypothetical protein